MKCPAEIYRPSPRIYQGLPDIDYPFHDRTIVVTHCGRIGLGKKKINFNTVFAGQADGSKEVHGDIWLVSFMDFALIFDQSLQQNSAAANSTDLSSELFEPRLLPKYSD